jgi:hypothetical protein
VLETTALPLIDCDELTVEDHGLQRNALRRGWTVRIV